jgi:hypothetical protein
MWRAEDLGGLELFRATLTEFAFHPHAHEEFFIALTETGLLEREAYLAEALVLLVSRYAAPPRSPRSPGRERSAVRLSREYLEEHAGENVTLQALARFAGLSAFHLCRVFRDSVGMTPHSYQTQVRVRRAKSLLRAGQPITVVDIGHRRDIYRT